MVKKRHFIPFAFLIFSAAISALSSEAVRSILCNTRILPKINLYADYHGFTLQKDSLFREKYYGEENMYAEVTFLEMYKILCLKLRSEQRTGFGKSPYGMIFHPRDASFGLVTYLEFNFKGISFHLGEDHRCFHEIDIKENPVAYWNKLALGISSNNFPISDFTKSLCVDNKWELSRCFSWYCDWGYYVRKFPGVSSHKIMTVWPYYIQDLTLNGRFSLFHWRIFIVNCNGVTKIGSEYSDEKFESKRIYWGQTFGIEMILAKNGFGSSVFINYILDRGMQKFDSKDRLLEIGFKLFK